MIEITNRTYGPLQLMVRSRRKPRSFTTLIVPGRGSGNNKKLIEDELYTEQINQLEKEKLITTRITKGER